MSTTSIVLESKSQHQNVSSTSKSSESLYSSNSASSKSTMLRRKSIGRYSGIMSGNNSEIRQRVVSARLHRFKSLQNQLSDALQHITTLTNENRLLKTLHKRQDSALAKYENSNAELPQLLRSHAEELRVWQTKCRTLNAQNRDLNKSLKEKETLIIHLTDQNKHLTQLNQDKNLEERETLSGKVHYLQLRLVEKDDELKLLQRRNHLEAKNFKVQLINEQKKIKELCQKLEKSTFGSSVAPSSISSGDHNGYNDSKGTKAHRDQTSTKTSNSMLPRSVYLNANIHKANGNPFRFINNEVKEYFSNNNNNNECHPNNANVQHVTQLKSIPVRNDTSENYRCDESADEDNPKHAKKNTFNSLLSEHANDDDDLVIQTINEENLNDQTIVTKIADLQLRNEQDEFNIYDIHNDIQIDIQKNEKLLDIYCDEVTKDAENLSKIPSIVHPSINANGISVKPLNVHKFNHIRSAGCSTKRSPIDPQKKSKLLAALKSIDSIEISNV